MADYDVGNIGIVIETLASETIDSLEKSTKALKGFKNQINQISKIDMQGTYNSFRTLTRIIDPFVSKIKMVAPELQNFSNAINVGKIYTDLSKTEAQIEKIHAQTQKVKMETSNSAELSKIKIQQANAQLRKTDENLQRIESSSKRTGGSLRRIVNLGKVYFLLNYTKRIGQAMAGIVKSAIDYEETLNKFQVSFGNLSDNAISFANKLTYAFNLSSESIMNYMATFNNMLNSIGGFNDNGQTAYALTKTLTQLGIDYASLFNVSVDKAMEQFQSVLSGQINNLVWLVWEY